MHRLFNPCIMILIAPVSSQAHAADAFQIKNEADNHADVINSDGSQFSGTCTHAILPLLTQLLIQQKYSHM